MIAVCSLAPDTSTPDPSPVIKHNTHTYTKREREREREPTVTAEGVTGFWYWISPSPGKMLQYGDATNRLPFLKPNSTFSQFHIFCCQVLLYYGMCFTAE